MAWLLIATGFVGALVLRFWWNQFSHFLRTPSSVEVSFSPKGDSLDVVVRELMGARKEVLVQANSIPAEPVINALVEAKKRGVEVVVLLDRITEQQLQSSLRNFMDLGLAPLIDASHATAHNRIMIIDRKTIITGSHDFTTAAESENAENLLVIKGHPDLVHAYYKNFESHKTHCRPPQVKPTAGPASATAVPSPFSVPPTTHKKAG